MSKTWLLKMPLQLLVKINPESVGTAAVHEAWRAPMSRSRVLCPLPVLSSLVCSAFSLNPSQMRPLSLPKGLRRSPQGFERDIELGEEGELTYGLFPPGRFAFSILTSSRGVMIYVQRPPPPERENGPHFNQFLPKQFHFAEKLSQ